MKTTAYIIRNDKLIAEVETELKNGAEIQFACNTSNGILVNALSGKISRAKKWAAAASRDFNLNYGKEVSKGDFLI